MAADGTKRSTRKTRPTGPAAADPSAGTGRVLVVDDEAEIAEMVTTYLSARGFEVTEAPDGDAALERILTERPQVVILDVMMPGLSGWEICKYVRERPELDDVRIVMATGIGPNANAATSTLYGADAYVDKPFDLKEVERAVIDVIRMRADAGSKT
jgi:DNA-binding response OmpR family regulator